MNESWSPGTSLPAVPTGAVLSVAGFAAGSSAGFRGAPTGPSVLTWSPSL
jgi:hypothetical protein